MNGIEIKIEKGVPVPSGRLHGDSISAVLRKMEIGDSIIWPANSPRASVSQQSKRCGIKMTSKKMPDGSLRVWRIA